MKEPAIEPKATFVGFKEDVHALFLLFCRDISRGISRDISRVIMVMGLHSDGMMVWRCAGSDEGMGKKREATDDERAMY
jgi:hypothetical protein